jgi:hypothetical protein
VVQSVRKAAQAIAQARRDPGRKLIANSARNESLHVYF